MKKKKITKAEVEKVMDSPKAKMFRKTLNEFLEQSKKQLKEKMKMEKRIKLRDMTKEQWDFYKNNNCNYQCNACPFRSANCLVSSSINSWIHFKELYSDKFLDQELEIETPDILDEVEKRYLRAVIKPFRDRVILISKYFYVLDNAYSIEIYIKSAMGIFRSENIKLPLFQNEMYKGMENNKSYTLEELDL